MSAQLHLPMIYIVETDEAVTLSMKCLLESHNMLVKSVPANDTLLRMAFHDNDVVVMELGNDQPRLFKLLNGLMLSAHTPAIILMTTLQSVLRSGDNFSGGRVKVLTQPVLPKKLVDTLLAVGAPL